MSKSRRLKLLIRETIRRELARRYEFMKSENEHGQNAKISGTLMETTPRRTFLRQLCGLPLVGGSMGLIGSPKAVAEPVTFHLLEAYKTWLHYEQRFLCWEMAKSDDLVGEYYPSLIEREHRLRAESIGSHFAYIGDSGNYHRLGQTQPSARAALVMSAVGCDWKEDKEANIFSASNRIVRLG